MKSPHTRTSPKHLATSLCILLLGFSYAAQGTGPGPSGSTLELFQKDSGVPFQLSTHSPDKGDARIVKPGETWVMADIDGPAVIRNIWFTSSGLMSPAGEYLRGLIIRIYWDDESEPSVETPFGDFFGAGMSRRTPWQSQYLGTTSGGFYTYFPMPFRKHARIEIENTCTMPHYVFFHLLGERYKELPGDTLYFHAQYRRENPPTRGKNYTILNATGDGYFAGSLLSIQAYTKGDKWNFLEGDEYVFIDGEEDASIKGTGGEDYFQGGWYFVDGPFNGLYHGLILKDKNTLSTTMYRFHLLDRINFTKSIRVEIEHGNRPNNEAKADFSSVAFWYQKEPHAPFSPLPTDRNPTIAKPAFFLPGAIEWEGTPETTPQYMSTYFNDTSNNMAAAFTAKKGSSTEKSFEVKNDGVYEIGVNFLGHVNGPMAQVYIDDMPVGEPVDTYAPDPTDAYLLNANRPMGLRILGTRTLSAGSHIAKITITGKNPSAKGWSLYIDCVTVNPVTENQQ